MKAIKIRYCGGCNPDYDRPRLAQQIQTALAGRCRFVGNNAPDADHVLILQGCATACGETVPAEAETTIHIKSPRDAEAFIEAFLSAGDP